ncbi:MAG: hypothetical protein PHF25_00310 [Candidatus Margulisbacteria bacterium]|nr:hypothetical protein [Candidatus Margulisiibacteriota bacterium]
MKYKVVAFVDFSQVIPVNEIFCNKMYDGLSNLESILQQERDLIIDVIRFASQNKTNNKHYAQLLEKIDNLLNQIIIDKATLSTIKEKGYISRANLIKFSFNHQSRILGENLDGMIVLINVKSFEELSESIRADYSQRRKDLELTKRSVMDNGLKDFVLLLERGHFANNQLNEIVNFLKGMSVKVDSLEYSIIKKLEEYKNRSIDKKEQTAIEQKIKLIKNKFQIQRSIIELIQSKLLKDIYSLLVDLKDVADFYVKIVNILNSEESHAFVASSFGIDVSVVASKLFDVLAKSIELMKQNDVLNKSILNDSRNQRRNLLRSLKILDEKIQCLSRLSEEGKEVEFNPKATITYSQPTIGSNGWWDTLG